MLTKSKFLPVITALLLSLAASSYADVLVILPETGPLANASDSIKRGIVQANHHASNKYKLKFINIANQSITQVLKQHVNQSTEMVIGPLDKKNVETLLASNPQVKTLALNHVNGQQKNVYKFALSKEEDALALTKRMQWDGVEQVIVIQETKSASQTQSFYQAMRQLWGKKIEIKEKLPLIKSKKDGYLFLGSGAWLQTLDLPKKNSYTLPFAIEDGQKLQKGLVFCDTSALYSQQWGDVINAYRQKPVTMSFQRLIAFGGDAWQIMDQLIQRKNNAVVEFQGRTGKIRIVDNIITRTPQCYKTDANGLHPL